MRCFNSRRDGFALAAAVLAMLLVGAIVTGGFYAASQETSIARSTDAGDLALYVAETGLNTRMSTAIASTLKNITYGTPLSDGAIDVTYGGKVVGNYRTKIYRLSQFIYVLQSVGTVTIGGPYKGATRTVAAVVRIRNIDFDNDTAVQVYGDLDVGGNSVISGNDWYYSSWAGCTTHGGTNAVKANPSSTVTTQGSAVISGSVDQTQQMDSADFNVFGDIGFDEVASYADYRFPADQTVNPAPQYNAGPPQTCKTNVASQDNWGAPTSATDVCRDWFPIIEVVNDLHISSSNSGQGILLVRGNLYLTGGFNFYGVVVVQGMINVYGTGGHINGTLITYGNGILDSSSATMGNSLVQYSSCAIDRAESGNNKLARGSPITNRSWMDFSSLQNGY